MNPRGSPSTACEPASVRTGRALPAPPEVRIVTAFALAFVGYFALLHWLIVSGAYPLPTVAMVCIPWCLAVAPAAASLLSMAGRVVRVAAGLVVAALVALVLGAMTPDGASLGSVVAAHADTLLFVENGVFLVALSTVFAASLRGPGDALVTRLARIARSGDMPAPVVRYTRQVTVAWAVFFALAALASTLLFGTQSRALWSAFVNLLLWPLAGAMFAIEYAIRVRVLHDVPHVSMIASIDAFRHRDRTGPGDVRSRTASDAR